MALQIKREKKKVTSMICDMLCELYHHNYMHTFTLFAPVKFLCMSACQCMQITPCTLAAFSVVYSRERAPSPLLQNAVYYTICL